MHANQIKQWKEQLLEGATGVFGDEAKAEQTPDQAYFNALAPMMVAA